MAAPSQYYPSPISRLQSTHGGAQQWDNTFDIGHRQSSANMDESHILSAFPGSMEMGAPMLPRHLDTSASVLKTPYAERCRDLLSIKHNLKDLSVNFSFDLPKIVVVGNKEAGKSSVIEAISGINLPRSGGTRCPVHYQVSPSPSNWSAQISLHIQEEDDIGFGAPQIRIHPFATVPSNEQLENALFRAQAAILSPHMHDRIQEFMKMPSKQLDRVLNDSQMLRYSPSMIHVDIKAPLATGLTFLDLPGLISEGEQSDISLVKNLTKAHLADTNTLILVTVPMNEAIEQQEALDIARAADEQENRTIVVLTKPDVLASSDITAQSTWKYNIESHPSFYCVRLLDDEQRSQGVSRSVAEKRANDFFYRTAPWDELVDHLRFGVHPLVNEISRRLVDMLEQNVPDMRNEVQRLLNDHKNQLAKLPSPVSDQHGTEVSLRIAQFCNQLRLAIDGDDINHPVTSNKQTYQNFKMEICRTVPNFYPFPKNSIPEHFSPPEGDLVPNSPAIPLDDITNTISRATGYQLSGHIPFPAIRETIVRCTKQWEAPAQRCFAHIFNHVTALVKALIKEHFGPFEQLRTQLGDIIFKTLESCKEDTELSLRKVLETETKLRRILTNNTDDFDREDKKRFRHYADAYRNALGGRTQAQAPLPSRPSAPSRQTTKMGNAGFDSYGDNQQLGNAAAGGDDLSLEHYKELFVMAKSRAYFQVAYKRFIDNVPLTIEHDLCLALAEDLTKVLFEHLNIDSQSRRLMEAFVSDHGDVVQERIRLQDRVARLDKVLKRLDRQTWAYSP